MHIQAPCVKLYSAIYFISELQCTLFGKNKRKKAVAEKNYLIIDIYRDTYCQL